MTFGRSDVAQQPRRAADLRDKQIGSPVVVEITDGKTASHERHAAQGRIGLGDIAKLPVARVGVELVALGILRPERIGEPGLPVAQHASVDKGEVKPAVAVKIDEGGSEPRAAPASRQVGCDGAILKEASRPLFPERVRLVDDMGHEQVGKAVAVHVAPGDAHIRGRGSAKGEGHATNQGFFLEGAVSLIDPQMIGHHVVGSENIG